MNRARDSRAAFRISCAAACSSALRCVFCGSFERSACARAQNAPYAPRSTPKSPVWAGAERSYCSISLRGNMRTFPSLLREAMKAFVPTPRSKIKRLPKRAHYDRESVYAILDAGFVCHIGYVIGKQPYVTPTAYWREGDAVYWHGSSKSRMLLAQEKSPEICLTVTLLDALVVARSGFHKSVNYRSAMLYGKPYKIEKPEEKLAKMEAFVERVYPGRWKGLRPV